MPRIFSNSLVSFPPCIGVQGKLQRESSGGENGVWILGSSLQAEAFRLKPENDIIKQSRNLDSSVFSA